MVGQFVPSLVAAQPIHETPAVILFTSGTEGDPKGVALSHHNLLSNVEQVRAHIALYPERHPVQSAADLPLLRADGRRAAAAVHRHQDACSIRRRLQPHEIVRRIRNSGATILLSTDTFISQYARAGEQGDLNSLRLAVCGAERLRDETRALLRKKYAIELLEGYGVTEASPVIAANQPGANRPGTVGKLMPGMTQRLEPVEGIPNAGRLFVKGPNVMLGYMSRRRARRHRAAAGRLARHRRRRLDRRGRLHRHSRPAQALCQGRRRDGVAGGGGKLRLGAVARP